MKYGNEKESVDGSKGVGPRVVVSTAAFHARLRGSVPGLSGLKETKMFLPHPRVEVSIVWSPSDREVACSARFISFQTTVKSGNGKESVDGSEIWGVICKRW